LHIYGRALAYAIGINTCEKWNTGACTDINGIKFWAETRDINTESRLLKNPM
jgi:hypothetical protein